MTWSDLIEFYRSSNKLKLLQRTAMDLDSVDIYDKTFVLKAEHIEIDWSKETVAVDNGFSDKSESYIKDALTKLHFPTHLSKFMASIMNPNSFKNDPMGTTHIPLLDPKVHTIFMDNYTEVDKSTALLKHFRDFASSGELNSIFNDKSYDYRCNVMNNTLAYVKSSPSRSAITIQEDCDAYILHVYTDYPEMKEDDIAATYVYERVRLFKGTDVSILAYVPINTDMVNITAEKILELAFSYDKYLTILSEMQVGDEVNVHAMRLMYVVNDVKANPIGDIQRVVKGKITEMDANKTSATIELAVPIFIGVSYEPIKVLVINSNVNHFIILKDTDTMTPPSIDGYLTLGSTITTTCDLMVKLHSIIAESGSCDTNFTECLKELMLKHGLAPLTQCAKQDMALFFNQYHKQVYGRGIYDVKEDESSSEPLPDSIVGKEPLVRRELPHDILYRGRKNNLYETPEHEMNIDFTENANVTKIVSSIGGDNITSNDGVDLTTSILDGALLLRLKASTYFKAAVEQATKLIYGNLIGEEAKNRMLLYVYTHFINLHKFQNYIITKFAKIKDLVSRISHRYQTNCKSSDVLPLEESESFVSLVVIKVKDEAQMAKLNQIMQSYQQNYFITLPMIVHASVKRHIELMNLPEEVNAKLDTMFDTPGAISKQTLLKQANELYLQIKSQENDNPYQHALNIILSKKLTAIKNDYKSADQKNVELEEFMAKFKGHVPALLIPMEEKRQVLCEIRDRPEGEAILINDIHIESFGRNLDKETWDNRPVAVREEHDSAKLFDNMARPVDTEIIDNSGMEFIEHITKERILEEMTVLDKVKHVLSHVVNAPRCPHSVAVIYQQLYKTLSSFDETDDDTVISTVTGKIRTNIANLYKLIDESINSHQIGGKQIVKDTYMCIDNPKLNKQLLSVTLVDRIEHGMMVYGMKAVNNYVYAVENMVDAYRKRLALSETVVNTLKTHDSVMQQSGLATSFTNKINDDKEARAKYVNKIRMAIPSRFRNKVVANVSEKRQILELWLVQLYGFCITQYFVTM